MFPNIPITLNTSDNDIDKELYSPCLEWCSSYDRGVGYFTSGWIAKNCVGMSAFASKGGKARWITSTILDEPDYEIIKNATTMKEISDHFNKVLEDSIEKLVEEIEADVLNAFAWMLYDEVIEMRFAIPTQKLDYGDFHDKFGVFYGADGEIISFAGSMNDSKKGFTNYESFKVFKSWEGMNVYIQEDSKRFNRLWCNEDVNVDVFIASDAVKRELFKLRTGTRPYSINLSSATNNKWKHQDDAVAVFMSKHNGILEMATGTGKTRTALKIIDVLFRAENIKRAIITMHGNDLLDQWNRELLGMDSRAHIFGYYGKELRQLPSFVLSRSNSVLLVSCDEKRLPEAIERLTQKDSGAYESTLIIFDEVHGLGSSARRGALNGKISKFRYRLGLSATPEREYDDAGNTFIENEVGSVIFEYSLEDAIKNGVLCEFEYIPYDYQLTDEEKKKKRDIIARYSAKRKNGEPYDDEDMYRELAMVNKISEAKLPLFKALIANRPSIMERCIIFVETRKYGIFVQELLMIDNFPDFHTYYGEDDKKNLDNFVKGKINCLITCKKISEGVDIKSIKNIVLFSSDKGKLVTTQRIGRCLRTNPEEPDKKALVVDFCCVGADDETGEEYSADSDRREWLTSLSSIRRAYETV
jgi:superfamily II DNA or RNA helicase